MTRGVEREADLPPLHATHSLWGFFFPLSAFLLPSAGASHTFVSEGSDVDLPTPRVPDRANLMNPQISRLHIKWGVGPGVGTRLTLPRRGNGQVRSRPHGRASNCKSHQVVTSSSGPTVGNTVNCVFRLSTGRD